jgi:hypothetical protein
MRYGWALDKERWIALFEVLKGFRWKKVPFSILEKAEVPREKGVYVLCAKPLGDSLSKSSSGNLLSKLFNAIYVGQAANLRQRFVDHCSRPADFMHTARQCFGLTMEFWYIKARDEKECSRLEYMLIDCLGPPVNKISGHIPLLGRIGEGRPA